MKDMKNILITGANGFIGKSLCHILSDQNYRVSAPVRNVVKPLETINYIKMDLENSIPDSLCCDVDCVVHLAGRAHITDDKVKNPLESFRRVNCDISLRLAEQALKAGVKRFVFISSIGVNGAQTTTQAFNELSRPTPHADYAVSKYEAEQSLTALLKNTPMELVIIRPPLVYGANAPGNFKSLLKLVAAGIPLPLAAINNQRSFVSLENLVDFISLSIVHPAAANEIFLISDGVDISTGEMVNYMAEGMAKKIWLLPVPVFLMRWCANLLGRSGTYIQLCASLVVDSGKARTLLGWKPVMGTGEALVKAGRDFKFAQKTHI
ncbi:MAG: NAD-dependent epimerase/dehydratase family protein [Pontibacterium sp.]